MHVWLLQSPGIGCLQISRQVQRRERASGWCARAQQDDDGELRVLRAILATLGHHTGTVAAFRNPIEHANRIERSCH